MSRRVIIFGQDFYKVFAERPKPSCLIEFALSLSLYLPLSLSPVSLSLSLSFARKIRTAAIVKAAVVNQSTLKVWLKKRGRKVPALAGSNESAYTCVSEPQEGDAQETHRSE